MRQAHHGNGAINQLSCLCSVAIYLSTVDYWPMKWLGQLSHKPTLLITYHTTHTLTHHIHTLSPVRVHQTVAGDDWLRSPWLPQPQAIRLVNRKPLHYERTIDTFSTSFEKLSQNKQKAVVVWSQKHSRPLKTAATWECTHVTMSVTQPHSPSMFHFTRQLMDDYRD